MLKNQLRTLDEERGAEVRSEVLAGGARALLAEEAAAARARGETKE